MPAAGTLTDALQDVGALGRQGRLGNNPGGPYTDGMDHQYSYDGGSDAQGGRYAPRGSGPGGQWTGRESPNAVAAMQQHVEQILGQYFTMAPLTAANNYSNTYQQA